MQRSSEHIFFKQADRLSRASTLRLFALIFILLSAQAVSLQHAHFDDLSHHPDCSICLKQQSENDYLIDTASISQQSFRSDVPQGFVTSAGSFQPVPTKSRAPPSLQVL